MGNHKRVSSDDPGLAEALARAEGVGGLAAACGVTSGAVSQWRRVPHSHVLTISERFKIAPYLLRPDLYRAPASAVPAADGPDAEAA